MRLREIREREGKTLSECARRGGLSAGMLSLVENGYRPSRRSIPKLAKAYALTQQMLEKILWGATDEKESDVAGAPEVCAPGTTGVNGSSGGSTAGLA